MSSNSGKIRLFTLELLDLECQNNPYSTLLGAFYPVFINLQINRTGIIYLTSWKVGHNALVTLELHALACWQIGSQVRDRCKLGYLLMNHLDPPDLLLFYFILHSSPPVVKD